MVTSGGQGLKGSVVAGFYEVAEVLPLVWVLVVQACLGGENSWRRTLTLCAVICIYDTLQ